MSVTEIHPEELFDKLVAGSLSEAERERLTAHLKLCAVCRFEYGARSDFEREAAEQRIAPSLPLLPAPRAALPLRRRRRSRLLILGVAAAVLISASGALAAALGGKPWQTVRDLFVGAPEHAATGTRSAKPGTDDKAVAAPSVVVQQAAAPPVASTPAALARVASAPASKARASTSLPAESQPAPAAPSNDSPASSGAAAASPKTGSGAGAAPEASGAAKLFAEANQARRAGQVGRASGLYHLLQEQYPGSAEAELSRVTLATLLLNSGDANGALAGFERYLAGPSRALEAEALVGRARALERLGRTQLEGAAWREVERRLPGSVYARQAAERLTALGQP